MLTLSLGVLAALLFNVELYACTRVGDPMRWKKYQQYSNSIDYTTTSFVLLSAGMGRVKRPR